MEGTDRLFLAIHLPDTLKNWMAYRIKLIEPLLLFQRWTVKEDLHLTLLFIGETQQAEKEVLKEALVTFTKAFDQMTPSTATSPLAATSVHPLEHMSIRPFVVTLSRTLGIFGRPSSPSVLWAGIDSSPELIALQKALTDHLRHALPPSFVERIQDLSPKSRPYQPHITLARQYRGSTPLDALKLEEASRKFFHAEPTLRLDELRWSVETISLYRSHLGRRPMYERLASYPLAM
ncbi:MAG: 2'-5' RNA ligase family protein [Candidatus Carbobacillus altaicus]|nr:2'-5' RNA ligase family protein [Candidatus Carbobacillus altaicus]